MHGNAARFAEPPSALRVRLTLYAHGDMVIVGLLIFDESIQRHAFKGQRLGQTGSCFSWVWDGTRTCPALVSLGALGRVQSRAFLQSVHVLPITRGPSYSSVRHQTFVIHIVSLTVVWPSMDLGVCVCFLLSYHLSTVLGNVNSSASLFSLDSSANATSRDVKANSTVLGAYILQAISTSEDKSTTLSTSGSLTSSSCSLSSMPAVFLSNSSADPVNSYILQAITTSGDRSTTLSTSVSLASSSSCSSSMPAIFLSNSSADTVNAVGSLAKSSPTSTSWPYHTFVNSTGYQSTVLAASTPKYSSQRISSSSSLTHTTASSFFRSGDINATSFSAPRSTANDASKLPHPTSVTSSSSFSSKNSTTIKPTASINGTTATSACGRSCNASITSRAALHSGPSSQISAHHNSGTIANGSTVTRWKDAVACESSWKLWSSSASNFSTNHRQIYTITTAQTQNTSRTTFYGQAPSPYATCDIIVRVAESFEPTSTAVIERSKTITSFASLSTKYPKSYKEPQPTCTIAAAVCDRMLIDWHARRPRNALNKFQLGIWPDGSPPISYPHCNGTGQIENGTDCYGCWLSGGRARLFYWPHHDEHAIEHHARCPISYAVISSNGLDAIIDNQTSTRTLTVLDTCTGPQRTLVTTLTNWLYGKSTTVVTFTSPTAYFSVGGLQARDGCGNLVGVTQTDICTVSRCAGRTESITAAILPVPITDMESGEQRSR